MAFKQGETQRLLSEGNASTQVIGVTRNYRAHCEELGNPVPPGPPAFFFKSPSSIVFPPDLVRIPRHSGRIDYEVEIAVIIGQTGRNIPVKDAPAYVAGITVAIDVTARDLQTFEKVNQLPWTLSKAQACFCPLAPDMLVPTQADDLSSLEVGLAKDATVKQRDTTDNMIFKIPELISYLSTLVVLNTGDVILAGTPAGVGPLFPGDDVECWVKSLTSEASVRVNFKIDSAEKPPAGVASF